MVKNYIVYADICCLNRPLDELQQSRIILEAEAVISILQKCQLGEWILLNSDAIEFEVDKNTDLFKKEQLHAILAVTNRYINTTPEIEDFSQELIKLGFKLYDALHLSFAQNTGVDVFLTTDDRLLRKAKQYNNIITILVENPVVWLMNILQEENNETN